MPRSFGHRFRGTPGYGDEPVGRTVVAVPIPRPAEEWRDQAHVHVHGVVLDATRDEAARILRRWRRDGVRTEKWVAWYRRDENGAMTAHSEVTRSCCREPAGRCA